MCRPDLKTSTNGVNNNANGDTITKKNGERIVSPHVPSGFARRKVAIGASMLGLTLFYNAMAWSFKDSTLWLRPADEFCQQRNSAISDDGRCNRSDLFAFQTSSAIMQLYMGGMGIFAWHVTKRVVTRIPQTPEGRLFGYLEEADQLNVGIFVYQTFDLFASMVVPEHNTTIFLAHHMLASITAWMSLEYQMVHYYAVFFGGCSVREEMKNKTIASRVTIKFHCGFVQASNRWTDIVLVFVLLVLLCPWCCCRKSAPYFWS
jgi:hypothetical protein